MLKLIQNEWMKLWSKKGTWIMVILLVVMIVGVSGLGKLTEGLNNSEAWTADLRVELAQVEQELNATDLTEVEKSELITRQQEIEQNIVDSIEMSKPISREKIILDSFGMMSLVTLLMIIASAGIVASEFSQGTIKMLLSRPVKRWKILTSKYLTVLLFGLLLTVVTYVSSVVGAFIFYPAAEGSSIAFYNSEVAVTAVFGESAYLVLLAFVYVCVMATLAFMIGSVFRSSALAIGVSLFLFFSGSMIVMFLERYAVAKFVLFAHDLTQYELGYKVLESNTMLFSIAVLMAYVIVFLTISYTTFIKRDITA
ncbi:ABC transporter permease [Sporosarcina sp. ANT_H38]|uniref:ABC transporter permease n=1 Tax=Sporosarcina sp. ANT_H38 TaxID=2597358 RepID=UPI0011F1D124|nr:ABC transporter permease [Sporosarcina sp. ANT_H38]KAA0948743.1 ABC transporter permease [Sporosarcina sp. ANT_H38]